MRRLARFVAVKKNRYGPSRKIVRTTSKFEPCVPDSYRGYKRGW